MQVHRIGYGIWGFYRVAHLGHLRQMTPKDAPQRLRILHFWERHGLEATIDTFGFSGRTLYRWRQRLRQAGGNPVAMATKSCRPRQVRQSHHDPHLLQSIRQLRRLYPNLGKAKLQVLLEPWCREHGLSRYILTCIDPACAFGLAVALPGKAACYTEAALAAAYPFIATGQPRYTVKARHHHHAHEVRLLQPDRHRQGAPQQ